MSLSHHRSDAHIVHGVVSEFAFTRARARLLPFVMEIVHKLPAKYVHKLFYFQYCMSARARAAAVAVEDNHRAMHSRTNESI